ncbi:uncharacterized protein [Antedon mediterranea]|uniref:uncharacterized protein n=1 Tax=Antedon mediterranea TaxID=105859 RepID=UPI003AF68399
MVDYVILAYTSVTAAGIVLVWYAWNNRRSKRIVFGRKCKLNDFMLKEWVTYCNHGSFGTVPRKVIETQRKFQLERESDPDCWYRYQVEDIYLSAVDKVAQFVGSDKENLVLLDNVTTGVNTVIKSLRWSPGDKILITNHTYEAVKKTVVFVNQMNPEIDVVTMKITFPIESKRQLVNTLKETLDANEGVKLVILDHMTSVSALLMPLEDMIPVCRQKNVMVMVDGAHAPGHVPLEVEKLGADFYTGNLHKWCFAPRGCAFLHINPKYSDIIQPLVTSHGQFEPRLCDRFKSQATRDYTSFCAAISAVEFLEEIGMDAITHYNTNMIEWAADMLSNGWGTPRLAIHPTVRAPFMALIKLPRKDGDKLPAVNYANSEQLISIFYKKYDIVCAFTVVDGEFWVRISAHIYNCKEDYFKLRDAVLALITRLD